MKPLFVLSSCFLLLIACNNGSGVTGTDSTSNNQGTPLFPGMNTSSDNVNSSSDNANSSNRFLLSRSTHSENGRYYFATCDGYSFDEKGLYLEIENYSGQWLTLVENGDFEYELTGGSKVYDVWTASNFGDSGLDMIVDINENNMSVYAGFKDDCPAEYYAKTLIDEFVSEGLPRQGIAINATSCTKFSGKITMDGVSIDINATCNFPTITVRITGNGRSCQITTNFQPLTKSDCENNDYSVKTDSELSSLLSVKETNTCNGSFMKAAPGNQKKSIENIVIQALHKKLNN